MKWSDSKFKQKSESGQALSLAIVCMVVLVIIGSAFMCLALFVGGEQELNTATKAGALNVAVQMLNNKTNASGQFAEFADKNGNITLRNVNLIYAKALIVALNAQDIIDSGKSNSSTVEDLQQVLSGANNVCKQLQSQLQDSAVAQNYFSYMSENNSVRMFGGKNPQVSAATSSTMPDAWKTAYVYSPAQAGKSTESNVSINSNQFPCGSISSMLIQKNGMSFLPGYTRLLAGNYSFFLIPFPYGGQPRLISPLTFNSSNNSSSYQESAVTVLPNCWSAVGNESGGAAGGAQSIAFAATNPEQAFPFAMQGYIRIKLQPNTYEIESDDGPCGEGSYGYGPAPYEIESTEFTVYVCECPAFITGQLNLENEPGNLYDVLFPESAVETGSSMVMNTLMQRVYEFCPTCTVANLESVLNSTMTTESLEQTYYIYCSKTAVPSSLTCTANPSAPYSYMNFYQSADSSASVIAEQEFMIDDPNEAEMIVTPEPDCEGGGVCEVECLNSTLTWAPGTGYNGFLGELILTGRKWNITGEGFCFPIPVP